MKLYKLTDKDGYTRKGQEGETLWGEGIEHSVKWGGNLCTGGCLHAYTDPVLAVIMDPIQGQYGKEALLWEAEGEVLASDGTKVGTSCLRTVKQVALPEVSEEQRVRFAILCAMERFKGVRKKWVTKWLAWAHGWLNGSDRSHSAAHAAASAYAAHAAASAAAHAAHAAAYAASAAAHAAASAASAASHIEQDLAKWVQKAVKEEPSS